MTMRDDAHSHRSRNLVRLVILAVALPSLLLTGMGVIAVRNEEYAARRRAEITYEPVRSAVAKRFNDEIDAMTRQSPAALEALVAWATGSRESAPEVQELVERHPYVTNFFVIERDGKVLVPSDAPPRVPSPAAAESLGKSLGEFGRVLGAVGCELGRTGPPLHPDQFVADAAALSRLLADPTLPHPARASEAIAHQVSERLYSLERRDAGFTRLDLGAIAERNALVTAMARLQRPAEGETQLGAHLVGDWRRVVLVRNVGGRLAGFELVPAPMSALLTQSLRTLGAAEDVVAEILPLQAPKRMWSSLTEEVTEKHEDQVITFALLKKTDLSWQMALIATGTGPLGSLSRTRGPLYSWALVLIVGALAAGIILTLRAVVREARLSGLKTDFVSSVSHDLRTPLTSIRMFTETLLLGRVKTEEERHECLQIIAQETERLSRLTERILDFSRMEAGRKPYTMAPTAVGTAVDRALAACRPLVEEGGFELKVEVAPDLPAVQADADALIEALINLLTNAVKYSPGEKHIEVTATVEGEAVAVSVADHGIGIPRSEQQRIFEMFYRVDCRRTTEVDGSGIGLSLVKHIVDAHGGRISVDSAPGRGSRFTIHLPTSPSGVAERTDGEHSRDRGRPVHRAGPHPKPAV
jgi:two-component system phosphate regulon sensor histidine kinase PhoR